ncbi:MAG: hypothetical protein CVV32_03690 [Methanomicrobiales archaeon HGW-Methanomicrobiales-3]|jgi:hypothetical protein|nr:MAG: hypothetical protein CVV32_03690 [Methanomicrobiales archaeon HGW-Methanomicrobiales-3]
MYRDNKEVGGRPHNNEILMIKMRVLAGWHGLSDSELELLAMDRLSFLQNMDIALIIPMKKQE